ncbi:DNA polymerase I, partial [Acinetobacter baumannii]
AKGEIEEIVLSSQIMGDDTAEEVVRLRRAAGKTSTTKFRAMLNSVCADGRVRGTLAYHGAGTGRWAGRLIQPQNFPRI